MEYHPVLKVFLDVFVDVRYVKRKTKSTYTNNSETGKDKGWSGNSGLIGIFIAKITQIPSLMSLEAAGEKRYDVAATASRLYIYENDELKLQYEVNSMKSLLWENYETRLIILVNHGQDIKIYTIEKQNLNLEQDLVVDVGYQIDSFYAIWSLSTLLVYDKVRASLNIYNIDKREDSGYITIDSENSKVHVLKDRGFQLIAVNYDNQLKTVCRFCNTYEFNQSGQVDLLTTVVLPIGYHKYHIVRSYMSAETEEVFYPVYGIVMTNIAEDKSLIYLMFNNAKCPFKVRTVIYSKGATNIQDKWVDPETECLYIKTAHELVSVPFFHETDRTL